MFDKDSGCSCPSAWQIASSKSVCAKRVAGWTLLVVIVVFLVYGAASVIHSQNIKHTEQVVEIDDAISIWETDYKEEVKQWKPKLINSKSEALQFEELNTADFHSQFSDLDNYEVVKYNLENISTFVVEETPTVVQSDTSGELNLTSTLVVNYENGQSLSLSDIPFFIKKKSSRSQKDCTLNHVGIWNTTDHRCYVYNQLTHLWYIVNHNDISSLAADFEAFPCDEVNKHYASYTYYKWNDAVNHPTYSQFHSHHNISVTLRSDKDPYVIGFTQVDILKNYDDNTKLMLGLIIGIVSIFALIIPFRLIMTEDTHAPLSSGEKRHFMPRR